MKRQRKVLTLALSKQAKLGLLLGAALTMSTGAYAGAAVAVLPFQPTTLPGAGAAHYQLNGATVSSGQASQVNRIDQLTQKLITTWDSFSIGFGQTVTVNQEYSPGLQGTALFRVIGNSASEIFGQLNASGTLFLVNRNGVLFGRDSQVNVGNFVASTMDIKDNNFLDLDENYKFRAKLGDNNAYNDVVNQGVIQSKEGYIVLLGSNEVKNSGVLATKKEGSVVLGASEKATLVFDKQGLVTANLSGDALEAVKVISSGEIHANGGSVQLATNARSAVVNVSGLIEANTLRRGPDGVIRLEGGENGSVKVSGALLAKGSNRKTEGDKIIISAGDNINIDDNAKIRLGKDKGFKATADNHVIIGSQIETSGDGDITIKADADKSGEGNVRLNASLYAQMGDIKISGVNINDLPPTGAGPVPFKKSKSQEIVTTGKPNKESGKIVIQASGNVNLQNTNIETIGGTASSGTQQGGDAGNIKISADGDVKLANVISTGGDGVSNIDADRRKRRTAYSTPNGGNGGNITITAGGSVIANQVASYGGDAAGNQQRQLFPFGFGTESELNKELVLFETKEIDVLTQEGGKGGNGGNITITAESNINLGGVASIGGNGGIASMNYPPCCDDVLRVVALDVESEPPTQKPNNASGGNGGDIIITAGNNVRLAFGAGSAGGAGGIESNSQPSFYAVSVYEVSESEIEKGPKAAGGNAGDVTIKAGNNANLGFGLGSLGGAGGTNYRGGNAGDINVEAGGAIKAMMLVSQGGQADYSGNDSRGSDAGDINVVSAGTGDIKIGMIAANSGDEVGSKFGKWGKGDAAKPGNVNVANADGDIKIAYIDTQGGVNGDGGNVTIAGANDVTLGGQLPEEAFWFLRRMIDPSQGGINTNGGWANSGSVNGGVYGLRQYWEAGTPGNNAGVIDVTANGNLRVGQITANGSDAYVGQWPIFESEEAAAEFIAQMPKLDGGNGADVTLRYGNTVSFIQSEYGNEVALFALSAPGSVLQPTSLPIIKNPDPMDGPNGPIADVPEGQITANGGLPNYYGVWSYSEGPSSQDTFVARTLVFQPTFNLFPLANFGTPGQIRILKLTSPAVIDTNPRNDAGFPSETPSNIPLQSTVIVNVGETASGGEGGEGCTTTPSNNTNADQILNFGVSLPEGVNPACTDADQS